MSKKLAKASQWIQRQIDDLEAESIKLHSQSTALTREIVNIDEQIASLKELLEKIPVEKEEKVNS